MDVRIPPWVALAALAAAACQGVISDKGAGPGGPPGTLPPGTTDTTATLCAQAGPGLHVGRTRLRPLTRTQSNNTVRDLLGVTDGPAAAISPDERIGPFFSNAIAPITDLIVQQHQEVAARLATSVQPRMAQIAPCDLAADTGDTCARQFLDDFGLRAYRRPLEADEVTKYLALYNLGRTQAGAANGFRMVVETMLQSPFFLYHVDVGDSGTPSTTP